MRGVFEIIRGRRISPQGTGKTPPAGPLVNLPMAISSTKKGSLVTELLLFETAKEILREVFNTTPSEIDEMIRIRMTDEKEEMRNDPIFTN